MHAAVKRQGLAAAVIVAACLPAGTAAAEPPAHYTQSCIACHARMTGGEGETLYRRDPRMVNDYNALRTRVEYCQAGAGAGWSAAQTGEVVRYLNRRFYHLPRP